MAVRQYVGARYVPKFADPVAWQSGTSYEALTIVTYNNASYTSKVPVPATVGNPADNDTYWALTGNYNAQVEEYRQETQALSESITYIPTNKYKTFDDVINEYNTGNYTGIYVNSDISLNNDNSLTKPCTITGNKNSVITLACTLSLPNYTTIQNSSINITNGTLELNGSGIVINKNNIYAPSDGTEHKLITINNGTNISITDNYFYSSGSVLADQNNIAIYYEQRSNNAFQNSTIANNHFARFQWHIKTDLTDASRNVFCSGIIINGNTFINAIYGIELNASDHNKIVNNIIDYNENPIIITSANGIHINNNYIFNVTLNTSLVNILIDGTEEDIDIGNNYIWCNNTTRTGVNGIYIHGTGTAHGIFIHENYVRMCYYGINIAVNCTGLILGSNYEDYCVYAGLIDSDYTFTSSYIFGNIVATTTSNVIANVNLLISLYSGVKHFASGSFITAVSGGQATTHTITFSGFTKTPKIFVINTSGARNMNCYVVSAGSGSAVIGISNQNSEGTLGDNFGYDWIAIE